MATGCSEVTGKEGGGEALPSTSKNGLCENLTLKNSHEHVESLRVRIRDQGNKGTSWLVSTTHWLIKGSLMMKPSYSSSRWHRTHSLLSC